LLIYKQPNYIYASIVMSTKQPKPTADLQASLAELGTCTFGILTILYYSINAPVQAQTTRLVGLAVMLLIVVGLWWAMAKSGLNEWLAGVFSVTAVVLMAQCLAWLVGGHL
jgi:hypothetical protein